jgi:hypothetical protein
MDPITGALLGGVVNTLFAPKPKYVVPDYQAIRDKAEKAGFNPLTALTQGPQGSVVQSANYMGSAISDALLMAAENSAQKQNEAKLSAQSGQIAKMSKVIENMTLRPKVPGIYAQPKSGGSNDTISNLVLPDRIGNGRPDFPVGNLRPLADKLPVDPRRTVNNVPINSSSGFTVIDNPNNPFPIYSATLDGDEPLQWYDLPTLGMNYLGSMAFAGWQNRQRNKPLRDAEQKYLSSSAGKSWLAGKRINKGGPLRQPMQTAYPLSLPQRRIMAAGQ